MSGDSVNFLQALIVPEDHPAFAGHFPGHPVVPGVVLLDLALRAVENQLATAANQRELISAKFLSPLIPGEPLTIEARCTVAPEAQSLDARCELRSSGPDGGVRKIASLHWRLGFPATPAFRHS